MKLSRFLLSLIIAAAAFAVGCDESSTADGGGDNGGDVIDRDTGGGGEDDYLAIQRLAAETAREEPSASSADLSALVQGHNEFTAWMYHQGRELEGQNENLIFSPYSISSAFSLLYPGAEGETADELADMLSFHLSPELFHPASNRLLSELESRADYQPLEDEGDAPIVDIVNDLWGLDGYPYVDEYLETVARNYGAGMWIVDFINQWEEARLEINDYIERHTHGLIVDLLPPQSINQGTRLVLTNAIYFKGAWRFPFEPELTTEQPFIALDGSAADVPMMRGSVSYAQYARGDNYEVVELGYVGDDLSMALFVPDEGEFEAFEAGLDAEFLASVFATTEAMPGSIAMPKFSFESSMDLVPVFKEAGFTNPFDPAAADFSGLAENALEEGLHITGVYHKAKIIVDEEGTEAAAATAIIIGTESAPAQTFDVTIDRPFIFVIRDSPTGAILFMGSIVDAGKAQ